MIPKPRTTFCLVDTQLWRYVVVLLCLTSNPLCEADNHALNTAHDQAQQPAISVDTFLETPPNCRINTGQNPCKPGFIDSVGTPNADGSLPLDYGDGVDLNCSLSLCPTDRLYKHFVIRGDVQNITLDCNGATIGLPEGAKKGEDAFDKFGSRDIISVQSRLIDGQWKRPENITIRNCNVVGAVRVQGLGRNGEARYVKESSWNDNHTEYARSVAPMNILFDRLTITGVGRNPFYLSPGVTHTTLQNSTLKGWSKRVAIYLDAESAYNTIRNNVIEVDTAKDTWASRTFNTNRGWPQINIDGSSGNLIVNNRFSNLDNGGIYLFRNCGEGETIRHAGPSNNKIINNRFYYKKYKGPNPAVFIGNRNYGWKQSELPFTRCHHDKIEAHEYGSNASEMYANLTKADVTRINKLGSAKSNRDFAKNTIVMQNQFYKRRVFQGKPVLLVDAKVENYVRTKNKQVNSGTRVRHNSLVSANTVDQGRKAGCYLRRSDRELVEHSITVGKARRAGSQVCVDYFECNDGELERKVQQTHCAPTTIPIDCQVEGSNRGCENVVQCPGTTTVVGAVAACNLEFGAVTNQDVSDTPVNFIKVVKESDKVSNGACYVGKDNKIRSRSAAIESLFGRKQVTAGCREKDKNGGDCHIKGVLYCG